VKFASTIPTKFLPRFNVQLEAHARRHAVRADAHHRQPQAHRATGCRRVRPLPQTLAAIQRADLITIGPGALFTSLAAGAAPGAAVAASCAPRS
jgi:hypothetical protein